MSCIPFWKACNTNIEYVDRSHHGLNHVPDELQRYSRSLEELILDSNHIRDLPKVIKQIYWFIKNVLRIASIIVTTFATKIRQGHGSWWYSSKTAYWNSRRILSPSYHHHIFMDWSKLAAFIAQIFSVHTEWCPGHDVKLHPHFHCHS